MMIDLPPPLTGNSPQIVWLNRLRAAVQRAFALEAPGTLATVTPFGTHRQSTARKGNATVNTSGGSSTQRFRVKEEFTDYLRCRTYSDRIVTAAAVNTAGTGYHVGDTLTVNGGTGTAATLTVSAVNGSGGVTGVTVADGGMYSSDPPTSANAVTGGFAGSSGAKMDLTMGAGEGSVDIMVAKPPELRESLTGEVIGTTTVGYTYSGHTRTASATGMASQTEMVIPVYHSNTSSDGYSEIWADRPLGGTGCSSAPVWMDTNRAARAWCQIPG